jgi:hypothetical protein
MAKTVGNRLEFMLRGLALATLLTATGVMFSPGHASADDPCEDCECVAQFGYCYSCQGHGDDCVFSSCNGGQCRYTYGYECATVEEPEWVGECEVT